MAQIQIIDWSTDLTQSIIVSGTTGPGTPTEPVELVFANPTAGTTYTLEIRQSSAVGSIPITATWNVDILFPGGQAPDLTLKQGAVDVFTFVYTENTYSNITYSLNVLPT